MEYLIKVMQLSSPLVCLTCILIAILAGIYIGYTANRRHEHLLRLRERMDLYKDVQDYVTIKVRNGESKGSYNLLGGDNE